MRIPMAGGQPYSANPGIHYPCNMLKPGIQRRDGDRNFRVASNRLGRVADAVWHIPPSGGYGSHSSVLFPKVTRPPPPCC